MTDGDQFRRVLAFLDRLDAASLTYTLAHTRPGSLRVDVATPAHRWEVEFMEDGSIEVKQFRSVAGVESDSGVLEAIFNDV